MHYSNGTAHQVNGNVHQANGYSPSKVYNLRQREKFT